MRTPRRHSKYRRLAVVAAALAVVATGCGVEDGVIVTGSSTVEPISIAVSEQFAETHGHVQVVVDGPGTGDGFELFCRGLVDVNDASSKIKPEQAQECADHGVEFIELRIGNDGIAVLTGPENDAVECLDLADLYALTGPEAQGITNWRDATGVAAALGSRTDLPDAPLTVVGPGEESGTFVSYVELVIEKFNKDRGQEATTRPDYLSSSDDNVIIQGVEGSKTSLGWVGFAFAREAPDTKILPIAVEPGGECIAPTDESIADGTYPIARPLFIYVNEQHAADNPALRDWVDLYLSDEGSRAVSDVGYVPLSPEGLAATRRVWQARETGPQEDPR